MRGDTGANALGAAWGVGAAASMSRTGLAATLMAIGALTVLSERVSFSQVIERTEALRYFDQLGRRSP
jgi:UDP-N-acetylmuramyl pentapeptide phosphotransferase/UDP-N-acetylglucosamine-1-phosphate transferase